MIPFKAFIIVIWVTANPAAPHDGGAEIWSEVFPDRQICEIALDERLIEARKDYQDMPVTVIGQCEIPGKSRSA